MLACYQNDAFMGLMNRLPFLSIGPDAQLLSVRNSSRKDETKGIKTAPFNRVYQTGDAKNYRDCTVGVAAAKSTMGPS